MTSKLDGFISEVSKLRNDLDSAGEPQSSPVSAGVFDETYLERE